MSIACSTLRMAGNRLIKDQAQGQVQTFFDELKNDTRQYRTIASLDSQIAQAYRGRCILELLQNAHGDCQISCVSEFGGSYILYGRTDHDDIETRTFG